MMKSRTRSSRRVRSCAIMPARAWERWLSKVVKPVVRPPIRPGEGRDRRYVSRVQDPPPSGDRKADTLTPLGSSACIRFITSLENLYGFSATSTLTAAEAELRVENLAALAGRNLVLCNAAIHCTLVAQGTVFVRQP